MPMQFNDELRIGSSTFGADSNGSHEMNVQENRLQSLGTLVPAHQDIGFSPTLSVPPPSTPTTQGARYPTLQQPRLPLISYNGTISYSDASMPAGLDVRGVWQPPCTSSRSSPPLEIPRKRGRPKGSGTQPKAVTYGPRVRLGRPPGTGHKQKEKALLGESRPVCAAKRPRGRPRKQARGPMVSVLVGNEVISNSDTLTVAQDTQARQDTSSAWTALLNAPEPRVRNQPVFKNLTTQIRPTLPPPSLPPTSHLASPPPSVTALSEITPSPPPPPLLNQHMSTVYHSSSSEDRGPSHRILIPEEDPQRSVEAFDEDEGSDAIGDGLGQEDADPENDDKVDDEPEPNDMGVELAPGNSRQRRPLPPWLLEPFKALLEESKCRDANGLPPLYSKLGTFWFPRQSTFFLLRQKHISPPALYNPCFFLWDPLALCPIPCPLCSRPLRRHAEISRPRRCVDMDSTFWIIGYRYRCTFCIHPKSKKHTVTFRSWDPRILKVLPYELAAEFPARLSHRSAISNTAFESMRSSFQSGMGSKQFSDELLSLHLLQYDRLQLQYLMHIRLQQESLDAWRGEKFEAFLPFDDVSPRGRHGFIPSSQWLRNMYDSYIEKHRHDFNQHTAMLSAEICAIDHSHKITKHVARVDGEQVFTGLLTVTNEKGEIRTCNLVVTKAQSQSELALKSMSESLTLYGHTHPQVFFTDNVTADKSFLERCFPSLQDGVVPIEKYGDLETFEMPSPPAVNILVKSSTLSINDAARSILDDVPQDRGCIAVGFDTKWNVEMSSRRYIQHRGKTAIVQIAYQDRVYILQISNMLANGELPHQLKLLLPHPRILKVGRLVGSDLSCLQEACHSPLPFVGGLDLAKYAKDRYVISNISKTSLADLCAFVLRKRLSKNVPERISNAWENDVLSQEQLQYAAKDAYVSLLIYEKLATIPVLCRLPSSITPSMPVLLFSTDNTTVIAEGRISQYSNDRTYNGIKVSPTRTVIDVSRVLVPGAIVTTHRQRPLSSFGQTPFTVVCLRSHLRLCSPDSNSDEAASIATSAPITRTPPPSILDTVAEELSIAETQEIGVQCPVADLLTQDLSETSGAPTNPSNLEVDSSGALLGAEILGQDPDVWDYTIHSRVLKDIWHVFHMFYISTTHGLRKQFTRELRDAIFIPDRVDKARINTWGATQSPPCTYESLRNSRPDFIHRHCKHVVPPPHILYPYISRVFRTYGPIKDPDTKKPLFSADNWKTAKNVLDLIKNGYLSDPPGVPLYTVIGMDKKAGGLPIYRCARGTNSTKGGVHTHIRSRLPKFGASIRHVQASLMDFTLRHNLSTGTYNSTGQHYRGHYSIWVTNRLQELLISLEDVLINPVHISGWVNGNLYTPTMEVLGILPIPDDIRAQSAMLPYNSALGLQRHRFLAETQNTLKPILPVHSSREKQLFRHFMNTHSAFSPASGEPQWPEAVRAWNEKALIMDDISYKLIENLKTYYTRWKTLSHVSETLSLSADIRGPLSIIIHDPSRSLKAPVVPQTPLQLHSVPRGLLDINNPSRRQGSMSSIPSASIENTHLMPHFNYPHPQRPSEALTFWDEPIATNSAYTLTHHTTTVTAAASQHTRLRENNRDQAEQLARQRVVEMVERSQPLNPRRKPRSCQKCAVKGCSGSMNVKYCKNPCQDCGRMDCEGRNSKRPRKKCWECRY